MPIQDEFPDRNVAGILDINLWGEESMRRTLSAHVHKVGRLNATQRDRD